MKFEETKTRSAFWKEPLFIFPRLCNPSVENPQFLGRPFYGWKLRHYSCSCSFDWKKVHPKELTWNLEMMVSNRNLLFQGSIFRLNACFGGYILLDCYCFFITSFLIPINFTDPFFRTIHLSTQRFVGPINSMGKRKFRKFAPKAMIQNSKLQSATGSEAETWRIPKTYPTFQSKGFLPRIF